MRKKIIHIAGISFLTVLLGIAVSLCGGLVLENRFGLNLLFRLRGSVQPPPEILIVSLGRYMAPGADVTGPQEKWPRSSYAELIENLAAKKASTICIDVNFKNTGDEKEDLMLSRAMKKAGNVILHEDVQIVRVRDQTGNITNLYKRKRSPTIPVLARSAAGCAPFFLPKKPHQVSRYWTFKPDLDDNPTLPVILYYFYTRQVHEAFYGLLESLSPDVGQIPPHDVGNDTHGEKIKSHIKMIRNLFKNNPNIFHKLSDKLRKGPSDTGDVQKKMLESLAGLFRGEYRYLNFYGPPGTITTISHPQALKKKIKTGAVVFIGLSELFTSKQKDSFITVFSRSDGVDLSGVEILATAFSNILENSHIQSLPMGKHFLFVVAWGAATGLICRIFSTSGSAFSLIGLSTLWTVLSFYRFKYAFVWYPLVIPICIQAPFAFFSSVLWKNFEIKRERRKIRKAFGYYIPDHLVDHLVENVSDIRNSNQSVHGVCMFTDARHFTSLSETVTPMELSRLMNQYYEAVSRPIARHGGILSRIVGDGMLVVWAALSPDQNPCTKSCLAALDIIRAVDRLHSVANAPRLPTRIGIHSGHFFLRQYRQ